MDCDAFLVSSIYPYTDTEQFYDKYKVVSDTLQYILTTTFNIQSPYIFKFVQNTLLQWHDTFLCNATISERKRSKAMSKLDLLWQIVVIVSDFDVNMSEFFDDELDDDQISEYEMYDARLSYVHERFSFINSLYDDWKQYRKMNSSSSSKDFINARWKDYIDEFGEFAQYDMLAQEYLIKKCLSRLISHRTNINNIIKAR